MKRQPSGRPLEADRRRQRLAGAGLEFAELLAIAQGEDHLAVRAQLGRHDIEQAGIDADNGDQSGAAIDVPEHAQGVAAELLDAEQRKRLVARRQHVAAVHPSLVEFERLRIGRADHRAVRLDQADILDRRALVDVQTDGLQRRRLAAGEIAPRELVQAARGKIDGKLRSAQNDLGQLVELMRLLMADDGLRGEMARQPKRQHARKHERRKRKAWSLVSHPVWVESWKLFPVLANRLLNRV